MCFLRMQPYDSRGYPNQGHFLVRKGIDACRKTLKSKSVQHETATGVLSLGLSHPPLWYANVEVTGATTDATTQSADATTGSADATTVSADATTGSADATTGSADATTESADATTGSVDATTESADATTGSVDATTESADATGSADATTESADATGSADATTGSADTVTATGNVTVSPNEEESGLAFPETLAITVAVAFAASFLGILLALLVWQKCCAQPRAAQQPGKAYEDPYRGMPRYSHPTMRYQPNSYSYGNQVATVSRPRLSYYQ
ncbi:hypothetical protein CAPTEDRAFT_220762 [Capitella teleta]|uniref:Uncharacterized protein n=1 Tax=Capitella teleta TaxID=283909 RepID=R7UF54_CAPTE|nr:hypothetical protein CAPTEDRAFT_220762 [Capitella teleta]|eukprot:ELU01902.1 hypothetical protein CAPTEDRAFT_220762 [Capitella teleta]